MRTLQCRDVTRPWLVPILLFVATVLLFANIMALATNWWQRSISLTIKHEESHTGTSPHGYSYIEDDYPAYYPINIPSVYLTPENTVHYQIFTEDAGREWQSVFPSGGGFVRLGPDGRQFGIALFHQMHCLARIRRAMSVRRTSEHVDHCFNYIRQAILCEANPTIEPVIPILGRRSVNAEIPRICRDWTKVYEIATGIFDGAISGRNDSELEATYF